MQWRKVFPWCVGEGREHGVFLRAEERVGLGAERGEQGIVERAEAGTRVRVVDGTGCAVGRMRSSGAACA